MNELVDTEPRILLQTLLDWEEDYVHPPHVCHQNYFEQAEEVVGQMGGGSNSVLWENPTTYDMMRELGNILKVCFVKRHSTPPKNILCC